MFLGWKRVRNLLRPLKDSKKLLKMILIVMRMGNLRGRQGLGLGLGLGIVIWRRRVMGMMGLRGMRGRG